MWSTSQRGSPTRWSDGVSVGGDAHRAGGALHDLHRGLDVVGVEVRHLGRRDLADLVLGEAADLLLVRDAGALLQAGGLLDQLGGGRGLPEESEAADRVD